MSNTRAQWSGRLGFILAATGSAIGLGNLWKFPYITFENNGGAFVLVYLGAIAVVGAPIMVAEIAKIIEGLKETGLSVVLVEQNASLALKLADRGYVLETGTVALEGKSATQVLEGLR